MLTFEQECRAARNAAKRSIKAAHRQCLDKWYRNTQRKPADVCFGGGSCALCQCHEYCVTCALSEHGRCCDGKYGESHNTDPQSLVAVMDYIGLAYARKYHESITVGPYTYYWD